MKILVATNNEDKAREILAVLSDELDSANGDNGHACVSGDSGADNCQVNDASKSGSSTADAVTVKTLAQAGLTSDPEEDGKTFAENARIKAIATRDEIIEEERKDLADYIIIADDSGLCVDALNGEPGIHSARFAQGGQDDSPHAEYSDNNEKMLAVMKDVPANKRSAHFITAACVLIPESNQKCKSEDAACDIPECIKNCKSEDAACDIPECIKNCKSEDAACDIPECIKNCKSEDVVCESDDPDDTSCSHSNYKMIEVEGRLDGHIGTELLGENGFGFDPLFFPVEYEGKLTNAQLSPEQKTAISHRGKAIRKVAKILCGKTTQ